MSRRRAIRKGLMPAPAFVAPTFTAGLLAFAGWNSASLKATIEDRLRAERRRAALVLQIHDELLLEAPPEEVPDVERLVAAEMRGAMTLSVPIEVSVHAGATWAECE